MERSCIIALSLNVRGRCYFGTDTSFLAHLIPRTGSSPKPLSPSSSRLGPSKAQLNALCLEPICLTSAILHPASFLSFCASTSLTTPCFPSNLPRPDLASLFHLDSAPTLSYSSPLLPFSMVVSSFFSPLVSRSLLCLALGCPCIVRLHLGRARASS